MVIRRSVLVLVFTVKEWADPLITTHLLGRGMLGCVLVVPPPGVGNIKWRITLYRDRHQPD